MAQTKKKQTAPKDNGGRFFLDSMDLLVVEKQTKVFLDLSYKGISLGRHRGKVIK